VTTTKKSDAKGVMVAMVTPFDEDERLDESALRNLVDWLVKGGVQFLFPCGSAGEAPKLTVDKRKRVIEIVVDQANGKTRVLPGTGTVSTKETLELTEYAKDSGADGAIIVTPYYIHPSQAAITVHYKTVSDKVDLPIYIYDVPGATGYSLPPEFVAELGQIDNIVGIKDSSGNLLKVLQEIQLAGDELAIFEGAEYHIVSALAAGADGFVTGLGNICPRFMAEFYDACKTEDFRHAVQMQRKLESLLRAVLDLWDYSSLKEGLNLLGVQVGRLRNPSLPMSSDQKERLRTALVEFGILRQS